jgi:transposase-like protein
LALVEVSVVEQRYQAVLMVQSGARVTDVASRFGVSRQSVHSWIAAYRDAGLAGLDAKSKRPASCPWQAEPAVEAAVCEMRREHPKWGPKRIAFELGKHGCPGPVPSTDPVRVQRRASATGTVLVARQRVCLGRSHKHETVTIDVTDTTLTVHFPGGNSKVIARTTDHPVRWIKAHRPRKVELHV